MNRELIGRLNNQYAAENLDFLKAVKIWKEANLKYDDIRDQIMSDVGRNITTAEAEELFHLGAAMESDYTSICKQFEVSKGRDDLIPKNIKENKIKMSPAIRMSMEKLGQNLYRHKTAKTYWTLKEKVGANGEKSIYLVAVDEPENIKKIAQIGIQPSVQPDPNSPIAEETVVPPGTELSMTDAEKKHTQNAPFLPRPGQKTSYQNIGIRDYGREFNREAQELASLGEQTPETDPNKNKTVQNQETPEVGQQTAWSAPNLKSILNKRPDMSRPASYVGVRDYGREFRNESQEELSKQAISEKKPETR